MSNENAELATEQVAAQAALVQQVGDLLSEWRKTCSLMGIRWTDKDAAEFIAVGLDGYIRDGGESWPTSS